MPGVISGRRPQMLATIRFRGTRCFYTYQVTFEEGVTRTCFCELILPDEDSPRDETPGRVAQRHF